LALAGLGLGVLGTALGGAGLFLGWKAGKNTDALFNYVRNDGWELGATEGSVLLDKAKNFVKNNLDGLSDEAIAAFEKAELSNLDGLSDEAIAAFEKAELSNLDEESNRGYILQFINRFKEQKVKAPKTSSASAVEERPNFDDIEL
jgi:hypothetical protein